MNTKRNLLAAFSLLLLPLAALAQHAPYTHADTLRGSVTPERAWWDLNFYRLDIRVDPAGRTLAGSNEVFYTVLQPSQSLQIDLQPPLRIEKVEQDGQSLTFTAQGPNAYFIQLQKPQRKGAHESVKVFYSGQPKVAARAPWDGGFSWSKDSKGLPFVATSCQGLGASVWWPCKDHMYDEPDSQQVSVTVPRPLMDVSNGRLRRVVDNPDSTRTFEWFVANPINNYGINANIANYAHFADTLNGEKGVLSLDYYVLPEDLAKAKIQFQQAKLTIRAFEHWFGPYPFYEDGYKLVQVPYLGMEHQSSVTYGNKFGNGYLGMDLSRTGWGKKWDYIIVHESGHEWFANNVTYRDIADMWVHESFTTYSEALFTEYHFGRDAGFEYARGLRGNIKNQWPIIGVYGVNEEGSGDMYPKGANMLHTIRQIVDNDVLWRDLLRGLNRDFYHQTVDGSDVETYLIKKSGKNLAKVFDQYLRDTRIPVLEYRFKKGKVFYRWNNCVPGFDMPVKVTLASGGYQLVYPTTDWKSSRLQVAKGDFKVDDNFYITAEKVK